MDPTGPLGLVEVVQRLALARDLPAIQQVVRTPARRLSAADGATFVLRDGDRCHDADEDAIAPLWKGQRFPMSACVSGWAMLNRRPAVIPDIYADARTPHAAYRPTFVKSLVMVPIRTLDPVTSTPPRSRPTASSPPTRGPCRTPCSTPSSGQAGSGWCSAAPTSGSTGRSR